MADYLAKLNHEVSLGTKDNSVGPNCIIAWRNRRKEGVHKGGGAHCSYTGIVRDTNTPYLPVIANGIDVGAISEIMMPIMIKKFEAFELGEPIEDLYEDELNEAIARLPEKPDEHLQ